MLQFQNQYFYMVPFFFLDYLISFNNVPRTMELFNLCYCFCHWYIKSLIRYWIGDYIKIGFKNHLPRQLYMEENLGRKLLLSLENNNELQVSCLLMTILIKEEITCWEKNLFTRCLVIVSKTNISYLLMILPNISSKKRKKLLKVENIILQ